MARAKKRVTIKDVANIAGVSYQTVSRVINNNEQVADSTRERVLAAISQLNFRPNLAARSLPSNKSYVIGFVIPYDSDYLIRDPNLLAQISGADIEAAKHGYNLLLSTAGASKSGITAYERFLSHQVADGVLVVETAFNQQGSELLLEQDVPHVFVGYHPDDVKAGSVHTDDRSGAKSATQYLLSKGYRRIGLINGPATGAVSTMQERFLGYREALQDADLAFEPALMVYGDYTRSGGKAAMTQLLNRQDSPDAVFALNDRMAMGAIHAIQSAGLSVPDDIAVVGFDDVPAASDFSPALTTVCLSSRDIGQEAARLLFNLILDAPVEQREITLPAKLIIRQSA